MEKQCLMKPNGGTVHAGKRDSLQMSGDSRVSLSHQLPANQLQTVSDDTAVIYSYTDGEFVPAICGSGQKSDKKDAPACAKSYVLEPQEFSMKTEGRLALCKEDTRIKINQATQTKHWPSRPRAVQCCCFPDSEDSEILNQRHPLSSSVNGWCHRADHQEVLPNGSLGDKAAGSSQNCFACVDILDRLLFHFNERDALFDFKVRNHVKLSHSSRLA